MMVKHFKLTAFLVTSLILLLAIAPSLAYCQDICTLDIYVQDEDHNGLEANIYVDDSYKGYDDHLTVEVDEGTYTVKATRTGYDTDTETVTCSCDGTKRVDLTLNKENGDITIRLGHFDVYPDEICQDEDETIDISIPVTLESGPDNTDVTVKFYVEDDGDWDYIGKDEKELDEDQTRTFEIDYEYDADDLDEGHHDIKAVIEADGFTKTEYADLEVDDCNGDGRLRVNVGTINLDPSDPDKGEIVEVKVYVTLESRDGSERVYVYGYIDNDKFYTTSKVLDDDETERFTFTFDTDEYSTGTHTLRVTAKVYSETDSSSRSFTIGKIYGKDVTHCLSIDNIRTDKPMQPGETVKVLVDVMSCGEADENEIKAKIEAFSKTYYTGFFDIVSGQTKEVFIPISIPDDVSGKQTIKVTVWNDETTDTWSKEFIISTGIPFIEIAREFMIEPCETKQVKFTLVNIGEVTDTFSLKVTGPVSEWITGVPEAIILEPNERKTIIAYAEVPCDTEYGFYEFTVTAEGSPKHSVTSTINVAKPWPMFGFPTGFFWFAGIWAWLPWLLLILLIIFLLLILLSGARIDSRRRPMFDCKNGSGC